MKKFLLILLTICFVFSGCAEKSITQNNNEKIKIITSAFPQYDFAKNIFGDKADVSMLLPFESDSHHFEPTPRDIIKINECDLFISVGGKSEHWLEDILKTSEIATKKILVLSDFFELKTVSVHDGHEEYDEHIWTSVKNSEKICEEIYKKAIEIDTENSEYYKTNFETYTEKLKKLDEKFTEIVNSSSRNTIIFGDRFPFLYFANDYNLDYYSAFPGCSSETEPSVATLAKLTDKIINENIPVVFHIEFSNEKIADILCENTDAKKMLFHSCHNITKKQMEENESYISLMERNAENLKEALR